MSQVDLNLVLSVSRTLTVVNDVVLSNIFGLSGILVNVISAMVFCRQGLDVSINITFLSMSLINIFSLIFFLWRSFCMNPFKVPLALPLEFNEIKYLTGGWPAGCTICISGWLTVYITMERVLSIVTPLKVKLILTPKVTALNISCICLVIVVLTLPEYFSLSIGWRFVPELNRTLLGLVKTGRTPLVSGLEFLIHAWVMIVSFIGMIVFTTILIVKLRRQTRWRQSCSDTFTGSNHMGAKQRRTVTMIIAFASAMIFFYAPNTTCTFLSLIWPDFAITGKMTKLTNACWSISFLFHIINSNVNILLFAKMSSKFRKTLRSIFRVC